MNVLERSQAALQRWIVVDPRPADYRLLMHAGAAPAAPVELLLTAGEALRRSGRPGDAWLVNVDLPDLSGLDLCEMLRSRHEDSSVCLVSDRYDPAVERDAWRCGARMFLVKPVLPEWFEEARPGPLRQRSA